LDFGAGRAVPSPVPVVNCLVLGALHRTHRIGQTRQVFAYRLITLDTVEEKVLELQKTKRDLADAIIGADNSLIRDLRPNDLSLLLS
jgi:SNF2 family DNA or RNA helicase